MLKRGGIFTHGRFLSSFRVCTSRDSIPSHTDVCFELLHTNDFQLVANMLRLKQLHFVGEIIHSTNVYPASVGRLERKRHVL